MNREIIDMVWPAGPSGSDPPAPPLGVPGCMLFNVSDIYFSVHLLLRRPKTAMHNFTFNFMKPEGVF